jgi:hypothetical protein
MTLLLPPGSDIRDGLTSTGYDAVEVPSGSGRYYTVIFVDDVGKGFPNEYRMAFLVKSDVNGDWPTPIP